MDIFGKIIEGIIGISILFLLPIGYFGTAQERLIYLSAKQAASSFIENCTERGYISKDMVDFFDNKLTPYGVLNTPAISIDRLQYEPIYVSSEKGMEFTGEISKFYETVATGSDLIAYLEENARFNLEAGDTIRVKITSSSDVFGLGLMTKWQPYYKEGWINLNFTGIVYGGGG